jgi:hypothetical protein
LGKLLDQHPVLGQQTGVMQPDAVFEPFFDLRAVRAAELEAFQRASENVLLFAGADIEAGEILRALRRLQLGEMDDIDGGLAFGGEAFERLGRPVSRVSSSSKKVVSPKVADMSRKRARGKVSNGVCQATPRSRSA